MTQPTLSDPMFNRKATALPYAGTTGHSGSDTSRERAEREAAGGAAAYRQGRILDMLANAGTIGLTYIEIADKLGKRGGAVTGALSSMHKAGQIAALKYDRRNGCGVYVLPEHVISRITRPHNENKPQAVAAPRKEILPDVVRLMAACEAALAQSSDQPFVRVKPNTMRTLLAELRRLAR